MARVGDLAPAVTAVAEIVGCYLSYLGVKQDRSAWLLLPAAASLAGMAIIMFGPRESA